MRLLEGAIVEDIGGSDVDALREENRELRALLSTARRDADAAKLEAARALGSLQTVLSPLYRALQRVFGELDAAGVDDRDARPMDARVSAVWDAWKAKIGGQPAQLIDAFLLHGEMTAAQIAIAIRVNPKNVAQVVHKLNKAGLIQKNGNLYSLKRL